MPCGSLWSGTASTFEIARAARTSGSGSQRPTIHSRLETQYQIPVARLALPRSRWLQRRGHGDRPIDHVQGRDGRERVTAEKRTRDPPELAAPVGAEVLVRSV